MSSLMQKAKKAMEAAGIKQKLAGALESAKATASGVTTLKCLKEYDLGPVVASGGPGCSFSIQHGDLKKPTKTIALDAPGAKVSVWILDKKSLLEGPLAHAKEDVEELLELVRKDAATMIKMLHPGVIKVVKFEEAKHALALVTERVLGSLTDVIAKGANLRGKTRSPPKTLTDLTLSTTEIKHGTLQLADALTFLHADFGLIHRALSPENAVITSEGNWKISGGFGHAVSVHVVANRDDMFYWPGGYSTGGSGSGRSGGYGSSSSSSYSSSGRHPGEPLPTTPRMAYVAPELVLGKEGSGMNPGCATPAVDIFSLGAIHYELVTGGTRWLGVADASESVSEYRNAFNRAGKGPALKGEDAQAAALVVQYMTAEAPKTRPAASALANAAYFTADPRMKALRSLDKFIELDVLARAGFLQQLQGQFAMFDERVLRHRVLPPLLVELRTQQLQSMVLPLILTLSARQSPEDFTASTLPALSPVLVEASGDALLAILRAVPTLAGLVTTRETFERTVMGAVVRGMDDVEIRVQEEALKQTAAACAKVTPAAVKKDILPKLQATALNTTAAAVRVNALVTVGKVCEGLGPPEWDSTLSTLHRLLKVDATAATLMCVAGVADRVSAAAGDVLTASRIIPLLSPLMLAPGLNKKQLAVVTKIMRSMIDRVERGRMPTLRDAPAEAARTPSAPSAAPSQTSAGSSGGAVDPFAASTSLATSAPTPTPATRAPPTPVVAPIAPLRPPPASANPVGGSFGFGGAGSAIGGHGGGGAFPPPPPPAANDDLASLFTEPGYVPPPTLGGGAGDGWDVDDDDLFSGLSVSANVPSGGGGGGGSLL